MTWTNWFVLLAAIYTVLWCIELMPIRTEELMKPFTHGYRNYGYDGREVFMFEFGRGTKRMTIWASDVEEAVELAGKHKFRGPYDRIAVRPVGVIGEPSDCRGR